MCGNSAEIIDSVRRTNRHFKACLKCPFARSGFESESRRPAELSRNRLKAGLHAGFLKQSLSLFGFAVLSLAVSVGSLRAEPIVVPNGSFESPATAFVNINIDFWQKSAKPDWYDEGGGFYWSQLTGAFKNPAPNNPDYIHNCTGNQAIWLFAVPEVGLFQDYDSVDWKGSTRAFEARFEVGKSYTLALGVIGGGGGMMEGAGLEISLYHRDADSNMVTVAATSIVHTLDVFPTKTNFVDFQVHVPTVKAEDAWAGKNIGLKFLSTVSTNEQGGYWDLDNVRLTSFMEPVVRDMLLTNGQFQFTLQSEPGLRFEVLAATNFTPSTSSWLSLGTLTNATGTVLFTDPAPNSDQRFYRMQSLPQP